jgi:hypothetical protein
MNRTLGELFKSFVLAWAGEGANRQRFRRLRLPAEVIIERITGVLFNFADSHRRRRRPTAR